MQSISPVKNSAQSLLTAAMIFLQTSNGCCLTRNRNSTKDGLMHTVSIWMAGNRDVDAVEALTGVWCSWQFLESLLDSTSIRLTLRAIILRVHRFRVRQALTGPRMMTGSNSWVKSVFTEIRIIFLRP